MTALLVAVLAGTGALLGALCATLVPPWVRQRPAARRRRRLAAVLPAAARRPGAIGRGPSVLTAAPSPIEWARRLLDRVATVIGGTGLLRALLLGAALVGLAAGAAAPRLIGADPPTALLVGAVATAITLWVGAQTLRRRWRIAFSDHFTDTIDMLIRAVRAGIPVTEAIRVISDEAAEPVRGELRRLIDRMDLGLDLKDALRSSGERLRLPEFDFFTVCIVLQRETGGQLAETLEGLAVVLRRRRELRLKVRALTAEGRMSAAVVGAMPIVAGVGMYLLSPDYVGRLLEPGLGQTLLGVAIGSLLAGIVVIHQMTRVRS